MQRVRINLSRILLIKLLLLAMSVAAISQEQAILVDEMDHAGCEDLSARLDFLLNELNNNPSSNGYVVVSSNPDVARRLGWTERFIDGYARYRGFEESRVVVVRGNLLPPRHLQMWRVPPGSELPAQSGETRYQMGTARKLELYSDFGEVGPCYTGPPFRILSKYLNSDPDLTANVAIGSPSLTLFRKARDGIIESFKTDYATDPSRLRFFWIHTKYEPNIYELWLIRRRFR